MGFVYRVCRNLSHAFARAALDYQVVNRERLIEEGGVLMCCNHVSYLDPPLAGIACQGPVHYLARKSLLSNPVSRWLFPRLYVVPIDQDRPGFAGLKTVIKALTDGNRVLIFPEGTRSPDGSLRRGEPGTGLVVAKARVPVVPMRLFGAYEALPFGSARFRPNTVTAVIGEPIRFDREPLPPGREAYQEISDRIMAAIAALPCPPDRVPSPREWEAGEPP
jgi:1-acyl-sn-glycerol-3-phosphate acyltransferase